MEIAHTLKSKDPLTLELLASQIQTWKELLAIVRNLPYGRNSNRKDITLVWKEQKGTCSSKHAFLKYVADLNTITNIELILGIYKMKESNTRNIGTFLFYKLKCLHAHHSPLKSLHYAVLALFLIRLLQIKTELVLNE